MTKKELNAVLAGLRMLQLHIVNESKPVVVPSEIWDIHRDSDDENAEGLTAAEIDTLCESLNTAEQWACIFGNWGEGFRFKGPFNSADDALNFGTGHADNWSVVQLENPGEDDDGR